MFAFEQAHHVLLIEVVKESEHDQEVYFNGLSNELMSIIDLDRLDAWIEMLLHELHHHDILIDVVVEKLPELLNLFKLGFFDIRMLSKQVALEVTFPFQEGLDVEVDDKIEGRLVVVRVRVYLYFFPQAASFSFSAQFLHPVAEVLVHLRHDIPLKEAWQICDCFALEDLCHRN